MRRSARWLLIAVAAGVVLGGIVLAARTRGPEVSERSVDAGFARDMAVHHAQAVQMAAYAEAHAPTVEIRALAASIAHQQQLEIGEMLGWLDAWGLDRLSDVPAMAWMSDRPGQAQPGMSMPGMSEAHGGAMPGMATPAQMDALLNMHGKRLEVRFLQLMIRHHQGGLPMAKDAAEHAEHAYVRDFAGQLAVAQAEEIDRMAQQLTDRGGRELPAPRP